MRYWGRFCAPEKKLFTKLHVPSASPGHKFSSWIAGVLTSPAGQGSGVKNSYYGPKFCSCEIPFCVSAFVFVVHFCSLYLMYSSFTYLTQPDLENSLIQTLTSVFCCRFKDLGQAVRQGESDTQTTDSKFILLIQQAYSSQSEISFQACHPNSCAYSASPRNIGHTTDRSAHYCPE